jgi:hypothetical protein
MVNGYIAFSFIYIYTYSLVYILDGFPHLWNKRWWYMHYRTPGSGVYSSFGNTTEIHFFDTFFFFILTKTILLHYIY